jgi:iron(III) transport system ATP-binding protein
LAKSTRVNEMLDLVKLREFGDRYPHQLSGGQQQRVAIARALAYKPNLLLLDEPFSNIDHQVRFQLIEDIRRIIKDQQVSAIFVTHSKDEAFAFSEQLAIMHQGKIVQYGTAKQLFEQPKTKRVAEFLGGGVYLAAEFLGDGIFTTHYGDVSSSLQHDIQPCAGQVFVRPQYIILSASKRNNQNSVMVLSKRFMGTRYIYRLLVDEQEIEITDDNIQFNAGDSVNLSIKSHPVNFFS